MNLYSESWEVIHMTSRTIRDLVPNLSGDSRCISSSAHFTFPASPMGNRSSETGHFQVHDHGQGHNCMYVCMYVCAFIVGMCFFLEDGGTTKAKERQGDAQPSLIPEESSISARSDPGGWLRSRGAPSHRGGWSRGSPALRLLVGLVRHTVRLAGKRLRGRRSSVFFFFVCNRRQSL